MGKFNVMAFSRLASALSVVRSALAQHQTQIQNAIPILDSAVETLQAVRDRGDTSGIWDITEDERPAVLNGIEMAENCIGTLDVALLERTARMLLEQLYGDRQ